MITGKIDHLTSWILCQVISRTIRLFFFNFVLGSSSATGGSRLECKCGNISLLF